MKKLSRRWSLLLGLCALLLATGPFSALPQEPAPITVAYRPAAEAFEVLDNLSDWWPGFCEAAYQEAWLALDLAQDGDEPLFASYRALREKHYDKTGQEGGETEDAARGLFTDRAVLGADPVASAFYRAADMESAYRSLGSILTSDELGFLRTFHGHFAERLAKLLASAPRAGEASRAATAAKLATPEVQRYLEELRVLFGVGAAPAYTVLYVWWPDAERTTASPKGPFLILNTRVPAGDVIDSSDVVVHEMIHVLCATMEEAQKKRISAAVLGAAPTLLENVRRLAAFEEPLATALGNIEYRRRFQSARFSWGRPWYGDPWVDLTARLFHEPLVEALEQGRMLDAALTKDLAALVRAQLDGWAFPERRAPARAGR